MVNGKSIRLIMNVRDDVEKLTKSGCLASVRPVIDSWYIKDTGSLDQTKDFIARELKGIPGQFGPDEIWVGHAHNRTLLLEEAEQVLPEADYNLMMDSDMELVIADVGEPELLVDSYLIDLHDRHMIYPLPLLTNARMKFIYHGVAHAYLNAVDPEAKAGRIRGFWHLIDHGEGQPREGKIERDMMLLRQAVVENPNDHRSWFYLAQSYRDLEMWPRSNPGVQVPCIPRRLGRRSLLFAAECGDHSISEVLNFRGNAGFARCLEVPTGSLGSIESTECRS
jgi:hypothetical protein